VRRESHVGSAVLFEVTVSGVHWEGGLSPI